MSRLKTDAIRNTSASADALTFDTNGNTTVVGDATCSGKVHITDDLASGQLLVGTSTSDATTKYGTFNVPHKTNSEEPVMVIGGESTTSDSQSVYIGGGFSTQNAAKVIRFYTAANTTTVTGTQKATIDSDGLKFNADTAATNALNDYEVGTWTPRYGGTSTEGTTTHSVQSGSYIKIGALVHVDYYITWTGVASGGGGAAVYGLPFSVANASNSGAGPIFLNSCDILDTAMNIVGHVSANDDKIYIYATQDNAGWANLAYVSSGGILGSYSYRSDA